MGKVRTKKLPYNRLMKEAVRVFNAWIRRRDGRCVQCATTKRLTAGHVITAKAGATRFDENNVFGQCWGHNKLHRYRPEKYFCWYVAEFGQQEFFGLVDRSCVKHKFTRAELEDIIRKYR